MASKNVGSAFSGGNRRATGSVPKPDDSLRSSGPHEFSFILGHRLHGLVLLLAVAVGEAEVFHQLGGDLGGVLALGVSAATEEGAAAAVADDHGFAALVAVDVGGEVVHRAL